MPLGGGGGKKGAFDAKGCPWELGIGIFKSSNPHLCPTYPLLGGVGRNIDGRINDGLCVLALDTIAFNTDHCFLDDCFDDTSISNNVLVTKVNEHSTPILTLHLYKQNTYKFIN